MLYNNIIKEKRDELILEEKRLMKMEISMRRLSKLSPKRIIYGFKLMKRQKRQRSSVKELKFEILFECMVDVEHLRH